MFCVYLSLAADKFEFIISYCDAGHTAETSISAGVIYVAQDDKSSESLQVHTSSLPEVFMIPKPIIFDDWDCHVTFGGLCCKFL